MGLSEFVYHLQYLEQSLEMKVTITLSFSLHSCYESSINHILIYTSKICNILNTSNERKLPERSRPRNKRGGENTYMNDNVTSAMR